MTFEEYRQPGGGSTTEKLCTRECDRDADCPEALPKCGVGPEGDRICMREDCGWPSVGVTCVDGTPTACQVAEAGCFDCGCEPGLRCDESSDECLPLVEEGEACKQDSDCRTNNCGLYHGVCRTPLGSPCTAENCDLCLTTDDWSFCSRECDSDAPCGPDQPCLGNEYRDDYYCRPECNSSNDPSCPSSCEAFESAYYCSASARVEPERPVGSTCRFNDQCESGNCYSTAWCYAFRGCETGEGYCSAACDSDSDCGTGLSCVDVPCADGESGDGCGPLCLRNCESDFDSPYGWNPCETMSDRCRELPRVGASGTTRACDVRLPGGKYCAGNSSCISGTCIDDVCTDDVPESGQANGEPCEATENCSNGICSGGRCRGEALVGDPCTLDADCAAGTCCDDTCCN